MTTEITENVKRQLAHLAAKLRVPFSEAAFNVVVDDTSEKFKISIAASDGNCRSSVLGEVREVISNYKNLAMSALNIGGGDRTQIEIDKTNIEEVMTNINTLIEKINTSYRTI